MADFRALAGRLRRYPDPETSTDPVVSALIGHLRALPAGPSMRADFRAELRAQLVAATPRLVAEGVAADDSPATTDRLRAAWQSLRAGASRIPMRRPLAVVGSLVVIFGLLLAGAVWMSSRTLPGDSLCGLKRASENVQLSLISGDGARGREYLSLARKRASEVTSLLSKASASAAGAGPQASGGINEHAASLVADTLDAADSDLRNGTRLLTGQAVHNTSNGPLATLSAWAPGQIARLSAAADRIPAGSLHQRAVASKQLAERVFERANQLSRDMGCNCLRSTSTDDLGPQPCQGACNPAPAKSPNPGTKPGQSPMPSVAPSSSPGRVGGPTSAPRSQSTGPLGPPTVSGSPPTGQSGAGGTTGRSSSGLPGLPSPPGNPSSGPIVVDTCGLHVTLGPIGLGLGTCGLNLKL